DRAGDREIPVTVQLFESPMVRRDRDEEPDDVQERESDRLAPRKGVADAAIQRVWTILRETDDVGLRLDAGQTAAKAGDPGPDEHDAEPRRHARVESALEEIERQRARRDEEHENPDGPVVEAVIELVAFSDLPLGGVLDGDGVHGFFFFLDRFL